MDEFVKALVSGSRSPLMPEEEDLYGCFVGEWDFDWYDNLDGNNPRHVKGEWIFRWILEGLAIQDVFICPSRLTRNVAPQTDAAYGTTVRMYNPNKRMWNILYTEWGCATYLEAHREGGNIVQLAVNNDKLQWVFSDIKQNSFRWQRIEMKDGKNWTIEAYLDATRK